MLLLFLEDDMEWMLGIEVTMKGWALDRKSGLSFLDVDDSDMPPLMLLVNISLRPKRDAEADALSVFCELQEDTEEAPEIRLISLLKL